MAEASGWRPPSTTRWPSGTRPAPVNAVLELDRAWSSGRPTRRSPTSPTACAATLRSMIVRLGQARRARAPRPRQVVGPFVEAVLTARAAARAAEDWPAADQLRDALAAAGVEVRDTSDGQTWTLTEPG